MARDINTKYREYLESGSWKCDCSPGGAHHWKEMVETQRLASGGYFRCKYCGDVRRFPVLWDSVKPRHPSMPRRVLHLEDMVLEEIIS